MSNIWLRRMVAQKCSTMSWPRARWHRFLSDFLPTRIKRLVFISSVYGYLKNDEVVSDEVLKKLNVVLSLSKDDQAIKLPLVIKDIVWKDLSQSYFLDSVPVGYEVMQSREYIGALIKRNRLDEAITTLIDCAPCWTLYGSKTDISFDLKVLIRNFA